MGFKLESREASMNGVALIDDEGRWTLLHTTGERPQASPQIVASNSPSRDGAFVPEVRQPLGAVDMVLRFHVSARGGAASDDPRYVRDVNLAELTRVMRLGRISTMGLVIGGVPCVQRCVVSTSSSGEELSENIVPAAFLVKLLDGFWSAPLGEDRVAGFLRAAEGGSGPVSPVWRIEGPCQGFRAVTVDGVVCEWAGRVDVGQAAIVSGWQSWTVPASLDEWWVHPSAVSTVNVSDSSPVLPDFSGSYAVDVFVDGVKQTLATTKVSAYCGQTFI
ncbi:hypothetical protein [Schaalia sp. lx-100]|uniref:hypothetical protein n=1 Tax=Schaalia sp. lx-100 TaxID=2899081 RepID=UPI001E53142A|nr:hypothetical protein [Schaalia sp. lx-100]MCD4558221.1 hypothetical protein [Schaalia sp. lx-100]